MSAFDWTQEKSEAAIELAQGAISNKLQTF
jgi:hypothetical protein